MNGKKTVNLSASIRARLFRISRERLEDFNLTLFRYAAERLLYRIGRSRHQDSFILKGAFLLQYLWVSDTVYRPTRDIDLLGSGDPGNEALRAMFEELCALPGIEDGITFDSSSIRIENIRENDRYGGTRVCLNAFLGEARIPLQVDIGFGDIVYPPAEKKPIPTILEAPAPEILMYPVETVLAEKLEAIISLGMLTSRMKDFYDVYRILESFSLGADQVRHSIQATLSEGKQSFPKPLRRYSVRRQKKMNRKKYSGELF